MADDKRLEVEGKSADFIFNTLIKEGLSNSDAAIVASSWIFENFGKVKRTFNYAEEFPQVDPSCVATFARSFAHADWIDGESVVQAEQSPGELGFNERFHRIEEDLDGLFTDVAQAFLCMSEMRRSLRALLDEIRAEVNRLNSDVHNCCHRGSGGGIIVDPAPPFNGLFEAASFLGATKLAERNVSLWKTDRGIMVLPAVSTVAVKETTDVRVRRAGALARFIEDTPAVRQSFPGAVTKAAFVEKFGNELTKDGQSVRGFLDILPAAGRFASLKAMVDAVVEGEAAALRTTSGVGAALATAFGVETTLENVAAAPVDKFEPVPFKVRGTLVRKGITTMEALVKLGPGKLVELLQDEGIEASLGEASEWTAMAATLIRTT